MTGTRADLKHWVPVGRRLVLVDIENLVGGSAATPSAVRSALTALTDTARLTTDDVVHVACGPALLAGAMGVLPGVLRLGRGIDGADHRLVELLDPVDVVGRYASVVLASGDAAAFAGPVSALAEHGVPTEVVIGAGRVGAALYLAAHRVTSIDRHLAAA